MKRILAVILSCIVYNSAQASLWQDTSSAELRQLRGTPAVQAQQNQVFRFDEARLLQLDMVALDNRLDAAQTEGAMTSAVTIQLPLPHGEFADYLLYLSPVMAPGLAAKYPEIRTFKAVSIDNPANTGRLDLTPQGFHAVLRHHAQTVFIDPLGNSNHYQSYYKNDYAARKARSGQHKAFVCKSGNHTLGAVEPLLAERLLNTGKAAQRANRLSFGSQIKTYRLAIAATGEFTQFHGGTKARSLAALVTGINRINEVYERDLAVKLEIVADNEKIVYVDPNTDPFDGSSGLADLVGSVINQEIGVSNYDVGHVISGNGIGGQASLGVICNDAGKAEGETSSDTPVNDPFFIDFVAHELGHQFGSQHSFNGRSNSCGGGNRAGSHAYEPGSGSTIMGYAGICFNENLQANSDAYFHSDSIEQIRAHLDSGSGCGVASGDDNRLPTVEAGANKVIPKLTPFTLTGSGSDVDSDTLTYTWEQLDLGPATRSRAGLVDNGIGPIFRSFTPGNSPTRTLPQLSDVLAGTTTYGEVMPNTSRDLNFRLTVRDGKGGVASDSMEVQVVSSAGPFRVTSPTDNDLTSGTNVVTWDVANTDAAPVSCRMVKIDLSTDGGNTFPTTLLASTTNNGSAMVTIPALNTSKGRIRISCTTQPFFAINSANISISSTMATPEPGPTNELPDANPDRFEVEQDSAANNFAVLDNDTDDDRDSLIVSAIKKIRADGTVTIASDGKSINYQPAAGFTGTEVINYTIRDSRGDTASANFTVIVKASENGNDDDTNNDSSGGGSTGLLFLFSLLLLATTRITWSHLLPNPAGRATKDND